MFYDRFLQLCREKGVRPTNACLEAGLSRGLAAKWKSTGTEKPSAEALEKLSAYFGISIDEILGAAPPRSEGPRISDEDIKFALFGGEGEITDAMYDEVLRFARMVKLREETAKKKE